MKKMKAVVVAGLLVTALLAVCGSAFAEEAAGSASFWDKTKVTGGIDLNYNYNFNRPTTTAGAAATNGYRGFDAMANTFNVSLVELNIANSPQDWVTFMTSLDFGRDATVFHGAGFGAATDIFDLKQAYVNLKAARVGKGLSFKIGKFVTMHGAEVIGAWTNNNASGSLLFNYAIPFTHTGIIASYPFADWITLDLGVVNGWNVVVDNNNGKTLHGQFTIKPTNKLTWYLGGTFGPETAGNDRTLRSLLDTTLVYAANENWTFTLNYDLGRDGGIAGASTAGISDWQGVAGYVHWKPFDFFALTVRGEFYKDDVGTLGAPTGAVASTKVFEGTGTTHFYLADGLDLRFEFRHDQGNNSSFLRGTGASRKFQDTVASQLVYSF